MRLNEQEIPWQDGMTLASLRAQHKPGADIVILNGYAIDTGNWKNTAVTPEDSVTLIERGEVPSAQEIENYIYARHTPHVADTLGSACVGIAGVGGLGSQVAIALARIGVGRLVLVDFDVVEPSNLNRQAYRVSDIGRQKVDALANYIAECNPLVEVERRALRLNAENVFETFGGCQILAECLDHAATKRMVVESALTLLPKTSVIAVSGIAGTGDGNAIRWRRVRDRFYLIGDGVTGAQVGTGLMAPRVMLAAGMQANAVVGLLLGTLET